MSDAFDLLDGGPLCGELACVCLGGAELAARGTGLLRWKFGGLLFEKQPERPFGDPLRRGGGDLLEGSEIDIQAGAIVAERSFGDNLCPAGCEVVKFLEFLGGKSWSGHRPPCLEVAP